MPRNVLKSVFLICLTILPVMRLAAQEQKIDIQRSLLTIHVGKAGLLSAAGHEHWVRAPFAEGTFNKDTPAHVAFQVEAKAMTVMPDDKLSAEKQADVQRTMQAEVLESEKYPEIEFRSTKVEQLQPDHWLVTGDLTLHGQTRSIQVDVKNASGGYEGSGKFKQTDFGIRPVTVGGLVKVKNELDIQFKVIPEGKASTP
jgi:polyisoprenoid-binding protein YceI